MGSRRVGGGTTEGRARPEVGGRFGLGVVSGLGVVECLGPVIDITLFSN